MRKILIFAVALVLMAACGVKNKSMMTGDYPVEYASITEFPFYDSLKFEDTLRYNIELNKNVPTKLTYSIPNTFNLEFDYPMYDAKGTFNFVILDPDMLEETLTGVYYYMAIKGDSVRETEEKLVAPGLTRWVMTHPKGKKQFQWVATDSLGMYMWGQVEFAAAKDTTVDLSAPIANIKADMVHMLDNLKK